MFGGVVRGAGTSRHKHFFEDSRGMKVMAIISENLFGWCVSENWAYLVLYSYVCF